MTINTYAVLACSVLAMALGGVWYGPLFGKTWMKIVGVKPSDIAARKEMQKGVGKLYVTQFLLTLFQVYVLAYYIEGWKDASGIENALWIWAAFIMPTVAGSAMWNNDSTKVSWARFLIQGGYQLILFVSFGLILGYWK
ncbi:DUF1761 domain-containing protein [Candidatus Peregrinibacteria bacterium]|nr:DUF1761 domain-containing protein [Candidatus Peregrinibacteria bacterium]